MFKKKPFSGKKKKEQLQKKRDRKRGGGEQNVDDDEVSDVYPTTSRCKPPSRHHHGSHHQHQQQRREESHGSDAGISASDTESPALSLTTATRGFDVRKLNQQPQREGARIRYDPNRYRLQFIREMKSEVERKKLMAMEPITHIIDKSVLEMSIENIYQPGSELDIPKRPPWSYTMSKEQVLKQEEDMFKRYVEKIYTKFSIQSLSYFELNIETWRQLWRVLEMSDIILLITDVRHPCLHFPPPLYDHVTKELKRDLILVLNKIDLVPASAVVAWKHYFERKYPGVHVVTFTSYPGEGQIIREQIQAKKIFQKKRRRRYNAFGPTQLMKACEAIVKGKVDLSSWSQKIAADEEDEAEALVKVESEEIDSERRERFHQGVLTVGCIGSPNVGKSSLLNGVTGKKVVSVSRTPGHTKHFQTIFLTPTVKLCDCPGLVFPAVIDKTLQVVAGMFPIAQVQEPYSVISYLGSHVEGLVELLQLTHPQAEEKPHHLTWSAMDICAAWALKRGFVSARSGRPDYYRAANSLLRLAVDGRICLYFTPPGYHQHQERWERDRDSVELKKMLEHVEEKVVTPFMGLQEPSDAVSTVSFSEFSTSGSDSEALQGDESSNVSSSEGVLDDAAGAAGAGGGDDISSLQRAIKSNPFMLLDTEQP